MTNAPRWDRPSDAPHALDVRAAHGSPTAKRAAPTYRLRGPLSLDPMRRRSFGAWLLGGVVVGLLLLFAFGMGRSGAASASNDAVTDNVVRLHAKDVGESCWRGHASDGPARVTVALEVGIDGKIRYATASGETHEMRGCVESVVSSWEFLPQAQAQTMALPVEIDRQ